MLEILIIGALSWFSYTQHERAVEAEVKLESCTSDVIGLNNMVIHWESKTNELEDSKQEYEDTIANLAEQSSQQQSALEALRNAGGRDSDYLNTPIPDGVWKLVKDPRDKD